MHHVRFNFLSSALPMLLATSLTSCDDDAQASPTSLQEGADPSPEAIKLDAGGEPFADLAVFFEFNSTDNDLGLQVFLDAEDWDRVVARSPAGKKILDFAARKEMAELGITELRFESAEPSPAEVLAIFQPGAYVFAGRTVEGEPLYGTADLSSALPPAAVFTPADGDEVDAANTVIEWVPIGGLAGYEVIVSNEDNGLSMTVELGPAATILHVPAEFMTPDAEYKTEVLTIALNGNKTIAEHVFTSAP
ncbi:MAG: hypothetical protein ABFS46_01290 [Myxococcota bacterium]